MATSKPEFQGVVMKDSGTNYCGLFKRRLKPVTGSPVTQYYWLPTNNSGDITDERVNIMNGTFSSDTAALAGPPSGYGTYADNWATTKYLSYMNLYPFDNNSTALFKSGLDNWTRADRGINNIVVPVFWSDVFDSYNTSGIGAGRRQDQNLNGSWAKLDEIVIYVKAKGLKVSFLINLFLGGKDPYNSVQHFWGITNNEKDEWNNPIAVENYGNGHPPLMDNTSGSGANMMKDFYMKVISRYSGTGQPYSLGAQLNWISPTITGQTEYGYNYENTVGGVTAKALSGYSAPSIAGFRAWVSTNTDNPNRYADKDALNNAWGTSFASFSVVTPPITGKAFGLVDVPGVVDVADMNDFAALFYTNQGKDWWQYLAYVLYQFAEDLRIITTTYASQAKFVLSFGGVSPNDDLCILRCTYDVIKWADFSDGMKTGFSTDNRNSNTSLTLDYVQNYTKKKMAELHHIDYSDKGNLHPSVVKPNMIASGKAAIRNGLKDMLFISMPAHGAYDDMMLEILAELKPYMNQNHDGSRQQIEKSTSVTLGELLNSGGYTGLHNWQGVGGSDETRVNFTFVNTVSASTSDLPYSLALTDVATYYFKQNDMRNSVYGRRLDTDSSPYTPVQVDYNTNRVGMLVSSHGITYKAGVKTKSTITIKSKTVNPNVVWLKMIQTQGVDNTEQNKKYENNHPELRNLPLITEDCRFWFPLDDYDIIIEVEGAACVFSVMNPNTLAPNRFVSENVISAGSQSTVTVLKATMLTQSHPDHRLIKINNNRNSDTP
jgi:hypothetical protein